MAIKVIAQRRELKIGNKPGKRFIMRPELYSPIQEKKVFAEAATHSGISAGVIKAAWDAAGEVTVRGPPRVTLYHCQVWVPCDSECAVRPLRTWRT